MAQKRSGKNSASRITTAAGLIRDLDMYFNDTSEASDADKDKPVAITALKASLDVHLVQLVRMLGFASTDFVVLDGGDITIGGSVYTVNNVGYAVTGNVVYKINTGSDTLVDTIRLVVSSTEDGLFQTLDIEDGTSGSGVVDYADIIYLSNILSINPTTSELKVKAIVDEDDTGPVDFPNGITLAGGSTTLDDYEEGTYTVTLTPSGSGTITLLLNTLSYEVIGHLCSVHGAIEISISSSPVGYVTMPLPFAVSATNEPYKSCASILVDVSDTANIADFVAYVDADNDVIRIYLGDGTSLQADSAEQLDGPSTTIYVNVQYRIA